MDTDESQTSLCSVVYTASCAFIVQYYRISTNYNIKLFFLTMQMKSIQSNSPLQKSLEFWFPHT